MSCMSSKKRRRTSERTREKRKINRIGQRKSRTLVFLVVVVVVVVVVVLEWTSGFFLSLPPRQFFIIRRANFSSAFYLDINNTLVIINISGLSPGRQTSISIRLHYYSKIASLPLLFSHFSSCLCFSSFSSSTSDT